VRIEEFVDRVVDYTSRKEGKESTVGATKRGHRTNVGRYSCNNRED
jgi:hypothetical protein